MLYKKLADRATVGFPNEDAIYTRALDYIYEAESRFARKTGSYQVFYDDLMVRADNSHIIDLPDEFKAIAGRIEWNGASLEPLADFRRVALMQNDFSWITGSPFYYFIVNRQLYLWPEPTVTTYRLGVLIDSVPPESRDAEAEVSTVSIQGTLAGGEYFYFSVAGVDYTAWFSYDGSGTDPDVTDRTSTSEITITSSLTDTQIATAIKDILDAISGITVTSSDDVVTITQDVTGSVKNIVDVNTGFNFHTTTVGKSAQTSPGIALAYHDILPLYARAQIYKDRGDYVSYREEIREYEIEVNRALFEISIEGRPQPDRVSDVTGGAPLGSMAGAVGIPGSNTVHRVDTTVAIRKATETFTDVDEVTVTHNWGTYPIVQVIDDNGLVFIPVITFASANAFTVSWIGLKSGEIQYQ